MAKHSTSSDRLPRIELPSWVPRFESDISPYELYYYLIPYHKQNYFGGELLPSQKGRHSVLNSRVLEISGTFYDTIAHAEPKIDPGQYRTPDDFWTALKQLKSTISAMGNLSDNSTIGLEFWRILLMDMYLEGVSRSTERVTRNRKARDTLESDLKEAYNSTPSSRLLFQLRTHSDQKVLCLTTNGTFALVLGDVQAGGQILVPRGASFPFILRPTVPDETFESVRSASIKTFYRFVGGAYVAGIMDGEVMDMMDDGVCVEESVFLI